MNPTQLRHAGLAALAVTVAAGLAACGGNDDPPVATDPFVAGTQVNVSATQTADGAFAFASGSSAADNTSEPLVLGDATLGKSETDEPKPL